MTILYIGVDVAKESLEGAYCWEGKEVNLGPYRNSTDGFGKLRKQVTLRQKRTGAQAIHLIIEPTGGYELLCLGLAHAAGWRVTVPNPLHVSQWAQSTGKRTKTDIVDARTLACYGAERKPAPQQLVDDEIAELDSLLRRRRELEALRRAESNRLQQLERKPRTAPAVRKSVKRTIAALDEELAAIEEAITTLRKQHPALRNHYRRLLSVPGIGPKTALALLVIFHRFLALTSGQGSPKQLVAYLGLDPQIHSSGTSVRKLPTISKMGDSRTRATLYMAALGGVRGRSVLRQFYLGLVGRGKAKKVALVAAARKILVWGWAVFVNQQPFDSSRFQHLAHIAY